MRLSPELTAASNAVSSLLSISQLLSSAIVIQAERQSSEFPHLPLPELAFYIFSEWATQMLDFLHELLSFTLSPEVDAPFDVLQQWVESLLSARSALGLNRGDGSLVDRIIVQLEDLPSRLANSTTLPLVTSSREKLAGILVVLAESGYVGRGHVMRLLRWLKKIEQVDKTTSIVIA